MFAALAKTIFGSANDRYVRSLGKYVDAVNALEPNISALNDDEVRGQTERLRQLREEPVVARGDDERPRLRLEALERHHPLRGLPVGRHRRENAGPVLPGRQGVHLDRHAEPRECPHVGAESDRDAEERPHAAQRW